MSDWINTLVDVKYKNHDASELPTQVWAKGAINREKFEEGENQAQAKNRSPSNTISKKQA